MGLRIYGFMDWWINGSAECGIRSAKFNRRERRERKRGLTANHPNYAKRIHRTNVSSCLPTEALNLIERRRVNPDHPVEKVFNSFVLFAIFAAKFRFAIRASGENIY
jgi:hypothetical protein